ncbi:FAD-dependent monooxygenase [Sphingomonas sp. PP-CE-1G-424]|uniref:FAD-dependent monooxygenase n=1 Tax=Sphingomonas sp. PP-CE-1G-424 TaxID=2135658 RepID=UPI0010F3C22A|nr:FAD-dependent monooxygenase [Sphingomonas sp. PP-CE-1G-424]TCP65733.1 flavin-dependent dehydrogenase [Sphingomonas sp. PP-CE-1G-424]
MNAPSGGAEWDVAVVGGGPAGCATALALLRHGVERVCIVEPEPIDDTPRPGESVPPDCRLLLEALGAWEVFAADGHDPCLGSCAAWGSAELGYNDFVFDPRGHGWHLDRARFDRSLRDLARSHGAVLLSGRVSAIEHRADAPAVMTVARKARPPSRLSARYLVDASGARGAVARRLGAERLPLDQLTCFYAFFDAADARSTSQLTMAEAAPDGWWYAAAVPGDGLAVAFATDPDIARDLRLDDRDRWFAQLENTTHIARRLFGCRFRPDSLMVRAAAVARLDRASGRRWLAVGDAAASYDPMSSQGLYKALSDALRAGDALARAQSDDQDIAPAYAEATRAEFDDHLRSRAYFYALEQRWADAPFWRRRYASARN